ncbi:MAG: protein translocase subunit SecD [Candidatus Omnitrophica bacterium]|nr:protein translocase subunit SecD [Candidatus Omnitrophota bacterium]
MQRNLKWKWLLISIVMGIASWNAFPLSKKVNLGLDLQGGMHLVLKVDTSGIPQETRHDAVDRALEIIRNRIDQFGVREPSILKQGVDRIVVQLPGITDRERALQIIGKTAQLEFKLISDDPELLRAALSDNIAEDYELKYLDKEPLLVRRKASLTGDTLIDARVSFESQFGAPYVSLKFNSQGAKIFSQVTGENVGRRLAIVLDGVVHSAPVIRERIPSGEAQITGRFSIDEANDLAIVLRAGALPAPIKIEEERTVGPSLGRDSIRAGIFATYIGTIFVVVFMIVYYFFAGFVADLALLLNFIIVLGVLGYFNATLTLPGIAGLALSLGMAVDANVLINERIREELKTGRSLRASIATGYDKAFSAIFDSNLTTLIAAFFLFQFGTGPIKGFAITLTAGILASLFTALIVTRTITETALSLGIIKKYSMLRFFKRELKFDFIGKRKIFYFISLLVVLGGLVYFFYLGEKTYGIDFSGGYLVEYSFKNDIKIEDIRYSLNKLGATDANIQKVGGHNDIIIRTAKVKTEDITAQLKQDFSNNPIEVRRVEQVGPSVGKELRQKAVWAIFWAMVGILVYVGFRFKHFDFGIAGVIALFHDVFVCVGFLAFTHREISLTVVAGLLTIAGYSINDTIVIYDRIRENMRLFKKESLAEIINKSINQTLSRTILTTLTTLFVVVSLFIWGGTVLNNLAFCLLVGMLSGIYSTIYIATSLVITWQMMKKKQAVS